MLHQQIRKVTYTMREVTMGVTPKTRRAALNRAATLMIQREDQIRKESNVMNSKIELEQRMEQLKSQQSDLQKQLDLLKKSKAITAKQIEEISLAHALTETEILETKQKLIQKQIQRLELQGK